MSMMEEAFAGLEQDRESTKPTNQRKNSEPEATDSLFPPKPKRKKDPKLSPSFSIRESVMDRFRDAVETAPVKNMSQLVEHLIVQWLDAYEKEQRS